MARQREDGEHAGADGFGLGLGVGANCKLMLQPLSCWPNDIKSS